MVSLMHEVQSFNALIAVVKAKHALTLVTAAYTFVFNLISKANQTLAGWN